ncbi:putative secreted protein [Granulibacter bethesdensis]|uniref:Secreted protein n=2 Tax=Granulibacter bethesdensis TaxID=364410 RepID=Q0BW43_GRABC|nr:putative secreted protein [Granulibacter bethesdensis CGDNIH1]AHJ67043.1 putative secreted protein [Granulibacter bethesdensis]APH50726.1 putative secreted protein [Granulibacter bethesdensis]APH63421.1 putative secreted protein [Granulibacter bethesdensis]
MGLMQVKTVLKNFALVWVCGGTLLWTGPASAAQVESHSDLAKMIENTNVLAIVHDLENKKNTLFQSPEEIRILSGPFVVSKHVSGAEDYGVAAAFIANQPRSPVTAAGITGGFYSRPEMRAEYGGRDTAGIYVTNNALPALIFLPDAQLKDQNNPTLMDGTSSKKYIKDVTTKAKKIIPPSVAEGTRIVTSLSADQVRQLQPGMYVEAGKGWSAALVNWDPGGHWLDVDSWVASTGKTTLIGFRPVSGNGTIPISVGITSRVYGINTITRCQKDAFLQREKYPPSCINYEGSNINWGPDVKRDEFNPDSDRPNMFGIYLSADGNLQGSAFLAQNHWDKGFVTGRNAGVYAGFLHAGDRHPQEGSFVTQQEAGRAFSVRPESRLHAGTGERPFEVNAANGCITSSAMVGQESQHCTVTGKTQSQAAIELTRDGKSPSVNSLLVVLPDRSQMLLHATVQAYQPENKKSGAWELRCLYTREGKAITIHGQSLTPFLPSSAVADMHVACIAGSAGMQASIQVSSDSTAATVWQAAYDAETVTHP